MIWVVPTTPLPQLGQNRAIVLEWWLDIVAVPVVVPAALQYEDWEVEGPWRVAMLMDMIVCWSDPL